MIPGTLLLQLLQQLGTALLCRQLQLVEGRRDVGPRLAGFRPWRMPGQMGNNSPIHHGCQYVLILSHGLKVVFFGHNFGVSPPTIEIYLKSWAKIWRTCFSCCKPHVFRAASPLGHQIWGEFPTVWWL